LPAPKQIVLVSGGIASGKSTLARLLDNRFQVRRLKTKQLLIDIASSRGKHLARERGALQSYGELLDKQTKGEWVRDGLKEFLRDDSIDGSTKLEQIRAIRQAFGFRVVHIHLTAPRHVLESRYLNREQNVQEFDNYRDARKSGTEKSISDLEVAADVVIDTKECNEADVFTRAAAHLGYYDCSRDQLVDVVIGGNTEVKARVTSHRT
jgi:adenylosuccinate synthase